MAAMPGGDWPALSDAEERALAERYAEEIARNFDPDEWREPYGEMTHLAMPLSEYFRRQGFCAVECDEAFVAHVVAAFGDDNLVTTTDYPHGDAKYPQAMDRLLALPLAARSKKKILWDNTLRLYAL